MTEFKRKESFLRRLWTGLKYGYCPGISPELVDLPDQNSDPLCPSGLVLRLDHDGIGHAFYNGEELQWVTGIDISVRPLAPVSVTVYMQARDGIIVKADAASLDFVSDPIVPVKEDQI